MSLAREYYIRIGAIVPLENRPTLRLRPGERERFEREARERAFVEAANSVGARGWPVWPPASSQTEYRNNYGGS